MACSVLLWLRVRIVVSVSLEEAGECNGEFVTGRPCCNECEYCSGLVSVI